MKIRLRVVSVWEPLLIQTNPSAYDFYLSLYTCLLYLVIYLLAPLWAIEQLRTDCLLVVSRHAFPFLRAVHGMKMTLSLRMEIIARATDPK